MIVPVILSGGSGTRLWPLSTPDRPKQFLPLTGSQSLFQQTLDRVSDRKHYAAPVIVANAAHRDLCLEGLGKAEGAELILEPCARNTAVAIVMAAALIRELHGPDALILVMPSDHRIENPEAFHEAVALAVAAATAGLLVTFAIQPTGPETGYGYLEAGEPLKAGSRTFRVARFTEKPVREVAEAMVAGGQHYWNGGIFLYSAGALLAEAARLAPEILKPGERAIAAAHRDGACVLPDRTALEPCPNLSIDYAVMERSDKVAMVPLSAGWSDVGGWDALAKLPAPVANKQLITLMNSANCYVRSDGLKLSLLGVDDLIVVAKGDRVLIMRKGESGHIRELAAQANAS